MDPLDVDLSSVSIFSRYAVEAARRYVELVEAQMSQAQADLNAAALEEYRSLRDPDEADYDNYVANVDRQFDEDYRPILRFTEVIYLFMVFETYVARHVEEIQGLRHDALGILGDLKRKERCGLVKAARIYFQQHLHWPVPNRDAWAALCEIGELRNCIVHNAGVACDSNHPELIYALSRRRWRKQSVGLEIDQYQARDAGQPVIIHQRFLQFLLQLLDDFFDAVSDGTDSRFRSKQRK